MSLVVYPRQIIVDVEGVPRIGAKAYFYLPTTSTPITLWTTNAFAVQAANPVLSVSTGLFPAVYVDPTVNPTYKIVIKDSSDVTIYTEDNVPALGSAVEVAALLTQSVIGAILYPATIAENNAIVTPTNLYIPHHLACGYVLPERYGGAADNSTLNDTAHANAMKVAYQIGDGTVVYGEGSLGIWKFNAPITIGGTNQGRRVVGVGRVEFSFNAAIANTLDLVTISADLTSLYKDQPQFDNIQVACNSGGRDGVVLTVGNRPLIRNVRINSPGRDGYVESVTGTNWIEKADVSVLVRSAGRNAFRQEILGTAGQNPFINEGTYFLEARGVSVITAGGTGLKMTGNAGLGGAAKLSDNIYRTVFDAIYNTAGIVPATSPVVIDTIAVENPTFNVPAWENTGTGGNPGAGPAVKLTSGSCAGLNIYAANWNSFWGDTTIDSGILRANVIDYSNGRTRFAKLTSLYTQPTIIEDFQLYQNTHVFGQSGLKKTHFKSSAPSADTDGRPYDGTHHSNVAIGTSATGNLDFPLALVSPVPQSDFPHSFVLVLQNSQFSASGNVIMRGYHVLVRPDLATVVTTQIWDNSTANEIASVAFSITSTTTLRVAITTGTAHATGGGNQGIYGTLFRGAFTA